MKNFLLGLGAALVVGTLFVFVFHKSPTSFPPLGASSGTEHYNQENFYTGFGFGKPALSSSSPAKLGNSPSFFMTATTTTQFASSTLIGTYSQVHYMFTATSPVAGVICNSASPASSTLTMIPSSISNATSTGFKLSMSSAAPGTAAPY